MELLLLIINHKLFCLKFPEKEQRAPRAIQLFATTFFFNLSVINTLTMKYTMATKLVKQVRYRK